VFIVETDFDILDSAARSSFEREGFHWLAELQVWQSSCLCYQQVNKQHQPRPFRTGLAELRRPIANSPRASYESGAYVKIEMSLRSEICAISPFVDVFMHLIRRFRWVPGSEGDIEVALREALANAIVHGNHEDPRKLVYVGCLGGTDQVSIVIRDEGQGFDPTENVDPTTPQNLESPRGRGIYLMESMMDEVHFERGGAVVYMRKSARQDSPPRINANGNSVVHLM